MNGIEMIIICLVETRFFFLRLNKIYSDVAQHIKLDMTKVNENIDPSIVLKSLNTQVYKLKALMRMTVNPIPTMVLVVFEL